MIITIDGPAASGKSSAAQLLAHKFSYYYMYTGLLYRALGYILVNYYKFTDQPDMLLLEKILLNLEYSYDTHAGITIKFNTINITQHLKTAEIDRLASIISEHPQVRLLLLDYQRKLAHAHNLVADGRDCGTIVFPQANFKFFLTASATVRAERWQKNQAQYTLQESVRIIQERDERDSNRAVAPLCQAPDAIIIDNSKLTLMETLTCIEHYII